MEHARAGEEEGGGPLEVLQQRGRSPSPKVRDYSTARPGQPRQERAGAVRAASLTGPRSSPAATPAPPAAGAVP